MSGAPPSTIYMYAIPVILFWAICVAAAGLMWTNAAGVVALQPTPAQVQGPVVHISLWQTDGPDVPTRVYLLNMPDGTRCYATNINTPSAAMGCIKP